MGPEDDFPESVFPGFPGRETAPVWDETDGLRVLVTGSRNWTDREELYEVLDELRPAVVLHGGCPTGADAMASDWCQRNGVTEDVFPAEWGIHGRRAGYLRNKAMVDERPDLVVAFRLEGSRGTQMTIDLATQAGLKVRIYDA